LFAAVPSSLILTTQYDVLATEGLILRDNLSNPLANVSASDEEVADNVGEVVEAFQLRAV
jgi:hypothetical protein